MEASGRDVMRGIIPECAWRDWRKSGNPRSDSRCHGDIWLRDGVRTAGAFDGSQR